MWRLPPLASLALIASCAPESVREDTTQAFEEPPVAQLSELPREPPAPGGPAEPSQAPPSAPVTKDAPRPDSFGENLDPGVGRDRRGPRSLGMVGSGLGGGRAERIGGLGTKGIGSGASGYGSGGGSFGSKGSGVGTVGDATSLVIGPGARGFAGRMVHTGTLSKDWTDYGNHHLESPANDFLSTFSIDVDTGSYTQARRMIRSGSVPPPASVRTEEFINYQTYRYPQPEPGLPFSITMEATANPWNSHHILRVGIQGARPLGERDPVHLTFLIDTSGSMHRPDKLPLAQRALRYLVDQLGPGDTVAIATYAGATQRILEPTDARHAEVIQRAIDSVRGGGGTAMESGMQLAYDMALEARVDGEENRVIVLSDGDANIGAASHDSILDTLESYASQGITLSTIGFGTGNYRDTLMEQLANKGDGNYAYIDTFEEAKRVFGEDMVATLQTIARDVKIQVEFDRTNVMAYRLIGYENREIADEDFRNDAVDAGEVGAGHTVTALYDLVLRDNLVGNVATVRVRHKKPGPEVPATEQKVTLPGSAVGDAFGTSTQDMRLAWGTASFAEKLRGADAMEEITWGEIARILERADRPETHRDNELNMLVGRVARLVESNTDLPPVDPTVLDHVVRRHMNPIRYCYQRELSRQPKLAGDVHIEVSIAPNGSVHAAHVVKTSMNVAAVERCIIGRFMRMQFPPTGLSTTVTYPFTFEPS